MSFEIVNPYEVFSDLKGAPLEDGNLYIGVVSLEPVTNPVVVYWDEALTIPATQPIRTLGGYPARAGSPSKIYITQNSYSIEVRDKNNKLVFSNLGAVIVEDSILFYDTKADLSAVLSSSVTEGQPFYMSGVAAVGDGGEGNFTATLTDISTEVTADTQEGIYIPFDSDATGASGGFIRQLSGDLNVRWYGAVGDGVADDTLSVQAALDWAKTVVQSIGTGVDQVTQGVFAPAGTYLATGVTVGEGTTFYGEGQNISMFKTVGAVTAIQMGAAGGSFFSGIWLKDIGVQGDKTTSGSIGVKFDRTIRNCGMQRVFVLDCDTNIQGNDWAFQILSCHIRGGLTYNIHWYNASHSLIQGCRLDVAGVNCIRIDGQTTETLNLNIKDCNLQSAQESALYGLDCGSVYVTDCDFESNNKLDLTTHADIKFVKGTASRTNNIFNIKGGFWSTGSSPGSNHVAIEVEAAKMVNVIGVFVRGNTFTSGVVTGSEVERLYDMGCLFFSVPTWFDTDVATKVVSLHRDGGFIQNNFAFDTASAYGKQDTILLSNNASSAGLNNYGGAISAVPAAGGTNRRCAIVPKQTGADSDQMGWAFFTHPSASAIDMAEKLVLNHLGELEVGGTGGPKLMQGVGTPEGADTAPVGSIFMRSDGGAASSMYVKESGTGNTGWVAK